MSGLVSVLQNIPHIKKTAHKTFTHDMMTFQTRLKNSRKPTKPRIRFELEKLNDPTVMNAFKATIGGRFVYLAALVDKDADLDSMVTHFNKAVTDTAVQLLGKQRRKRNP